MNGVCRCYLIITRNIFVQHQKQDFVAISSVTSYLLPGHIRSKSTSVVPVKLAYASYESMKGTKNSSKHPIILMHGLFGSKNNWNSLSKAIHQQTDRKVITIDARNHGDSPHSTEMSYEHMAKDVVQLMNDLEFEKSILVGHSMGGSTMMYVALYYPELVEKLVVVDMSPVRTSPKLMEIKKVFRAMQTVQLNNIPTLTKARKVAEEQLANHDVKPLAIRQFLTMNLVEANNGKYKWRVNLPVLEQNFDSNIAKFPRSETKVYEGPTLFIGGANSDYIQVEDHNEIKKYFPSSQFVYISDADHWVHADKPTEFLKIAVNFINQP
ncbi:protein ABHD11 [Hylaeus anthracinus]|uniref:protein ABHD11 n=1 Tax=Hylaeus volcanicus TaxID=313075 RepID=UPI0023B78F17|nr:protein ABHD11 [Hylaeus volcanicus]XP_053979851.1 protein ABHD11 [Hylaeus volcanicus]XP_054014929.1 protein ABHD11 [Hylaeus anthracinus]XP_054014930.1 protein ABHD11 [Hylaeus anthracinus]